MRGFGERDLATDTGIVANVELYTPDLCGRAGWQCRLLGFYDTAWGERNHALPGELHHAAISSTGLGLRFALGVNNLSDKNPPTCLSCSLNGYDASTYDLPGRFWYARLGFDF